MKHVACLLLVAAATRSVRPLLGRERFWMPLARVSTSIDLPALFACLVRPSAAGKLFLVHTKLDGVITFRFAIGATNTQPHHIREAWAVMQQQLDAAPKN